MMSLFPMAILTLFQQGHLGLSMTEIMVVQALFGLSLAVFEFPSGYLADRIGYRASLFFASALSIGGWGFVAPVLAHAEQAEIPSGDRASLVSLRSLLCGLSFVIVGPSAGLAIDRHGQHAVLITLGIGFLFACGLTLRFLTRAPAARTAEAEQPRLAH
jgi:MFS family permease